MRSSLLVPWFSGHRDKDALTLVFTVEYLRVYEREHLDPYEFRVVIPVPSIRMISFFDPAVYPAFVVDEGPRSQANEQGEQAAGPTM